MHSREEHGRSALPVYEVEDVTEISTTLTHDQDVAHAFAHFQAQNKLAVYAEGLEAGGEEPPKDLVYWLALEDRLAQSLKIESATHTQQIANIAMASVFSTQNPKKVVDVLQKSWTLSSDEVRKYFYEKFSQYYEYLAGRHQQGSAESQFLHESDPMYFVRLAEAVQVTIWHDDTINSSDKQQQSQRLWREARSVALLFLDANKINLVINYIAFAPDSLAEHDMIQRLAIRLREEPEYNDEAEYVKIFQRILLALHHRRQREIFIKASSKHKWR